jgi:hypothetical protein
MKPKRIQLSRRKGSRKPDGAVVVARLSRLGNPFTMAAYQEYMDPTASDNEARRACVDAFRDWLRGNTWAAGSGPEWEQRRADYLAALPGLRGKDLACWCPLDQPCHGDVLLEMANVPEPAA